MKFQIRGKTFRHAVGQMHLVASKGIASGCADARRLTLEVLRNNRVILSATNGCLHARLTLARSDDPFLKTIRPGRVVVDSAAIKKISTAMAGNEHGDHLLALRLEEDCVVVEDGMTKQVARLKCRSKQPTTFMWPSTGTRLRFESATFARAVGAVARLRPPSLRNHKPRYAMICLHSTEGEMRFICGDGMRFGIYAFPWTRASSETETRFLLPAEQAEIMAQLAGDARAITLTYPDSTHCHATIDDHVEMFVTGIPDERYIRYDKHAYRSAEARWVLDTTRSQLRAAMSFIDAARDLEREQQDCVPTVILSGDSSALCVENDSHQVSAPLAAQLHPLTNEARLRCEIFCEHLRDVVKANRGENVRLHFVGDSSVLAKVGDLGSEPEDADGLPGFMPRADGTTMQFFFAPVLEEQDEDDE